MALRLFLLIAVFSLTLFSVSARSSDSDLVSELLALQAHSKSGVIHLDDHSISRFLTSVKTPRPYWLLVFFDATQLHDKSELQLKTLLAEYSLVANSFITNNNDPDSPYHGKIFFCELEFKQSQASFALFGVNALPHVRLVGPTQSAKESIQMDSGDFSKLAESMAQFVESRTNLVVGPIHRPPMLSNKQLALVALGILIWIPFAVKKIVNGDTLLHDPKLWMVGSVSVYFFSVSGAMHTIIRKMPLFLADRQDPNRMIFFYQGSGMQLGAEGFAVGFLYTIVGLLLALMTHVLVRVRNVNVQRLVMLVSLFVSFWAVKKVIYLDNWKTGYGIHAFWPSRWN